ncbi:MAG: efflux RND transporter periplasmic adaptor subunit [Deltaproteobacteria bacterium]|nr:efflux RND transporter periplasmic adaptor subunit [Deltaproteobacteria bacterium]
MLRKIVVILSLLSCGCQNHATDKKAAPAATKTFKEVKAAVIKYQVRPQTYQAVGTTRPDATIVLSARNTGVVRRLTVKEGDRVKQGQELIVLDPRYVKAGARQTKAALAEADQGREAANSALKSAQVNFKLANQTYNRYKTLKIDSSVSRQELDEVESKYRQARAELDRVRAMAGATQERRVQAQAAVDQSQATKDDSIITAPEDGRILDKKIEAGSLAVTGQPLLVMETTGNYRLEVSLPEEYINSISEGAEPLVYIEALGLKNITGRVTVIVPEADPATRSFLVKISLPGRPDYRTGLYGEAIFNVGRKNTMLIDQAAVVSSGQLTGVFTIDRQKTARFTLIRTGRTEGAEVEALSGLNEGDVYVRVIPAGLKDGDKIETTHGK